MFWNYNSKNESWSCRYQIKRDALYQKADFYGWKIGHYLCGRGHLWINGGEASIIFEFILLKVFMIDKVSAFFWNELYKSECISKARKILHLYSLNKYIPSHQSRPSLIPCFLSPFFASLQMLSEHRFARFFYQSHATRMTLLEKIFSYFIAISMFKKKIVTIVFIWVFF